MCGFQIIQWRQRYRLTKRRYAPPQGGQYAFCWVSSPILGFSRVCRAGCRLAADMSASRRPHAFGYNRVTFFRVRAMLLNAPTLNAGSQNVPLS